MDGQENIKIYNLLDEFYKLLSNETWISKYVFWELRLLKYIGFDLNIIDFCKFEDINGKRKYFVESSTKKITVPNFLVDNYKNKITDTDIYNSLILISEYMKKNIFIPNNMNLPFSRINFINYFK